MISHACWFWLPLIIHGAAEAEPSYAQLIATQYPNRRDLPEDARTAISPSILAEVRKHLPNAVVRAATSARGQSWVLTDQGPFRLADGRLSPLDVGPRTLEPGQPSLRAGLRLSDLAADRLGHFWLASSGGLLVCDGAQWWHPITRQDGVPYEFMTCVHLGPNGDVWGGTHEGAWRLRQGQFRYFWGRRWLPGNGVHAIGTDRQGRTWIATDRGISCIEERTMTLSEKARHFDTILQKRHRRRGFINEIVSSAPGEFQQNPRFIVSDNDGLWNAIYVAAMAFRYGATKDPAAHRQAREALEALLELERLSGVPGYPARALVTDDELKAGILGVNLDERVRVPGELDKIWYRLPVDPKVWCKGDTSSDEIDGHFFAWYVYYELAATEKEKERLRAIVRRTTDHIMSNDYNLVGHTGRKTRWGIWDPRLINHDPFYYELRPLNSLEILAFLKIAVHITKEKKYAKAYEKLVEKHHYLLNALMMRRGAAGRWMSINHSDDELLYLVYYPLLRLEERPDYRRILVQSIARTWEPDPYTQCLKAEKNPLYNFIYGATTGRPNDVESAVATLQDWSWDLIDWPIKNSHRHDVVMKASTGGRRRPEIDRVLPASERHITRWNGNPWIPDGGGDGRTESDGAAWQLAYWLGVYHGFLPRGS